jgi:hypothetical protein
VGFLVRQTAEQVLLVVGRPQHFSDLLVEEHLRLALRPCQAITWLEVQ